LRRRALAEQGEAAVAAHAAILFVELAELGADALGSLSGAGIAPAAALQALQFRTPRVAGRRLRRRRAAEGRQRQERHAEASGQSQHHRKSGHVIQCRKPAAGGRTILPRTPAKRDGTMERALRPTGAGTPAGPRVRMPHP